MRKMAIVGGVAIVLATAVIAAFYLGPSAPRSGTARPGAWIAMRLPANRLLAGNRVVREFGPWRVACKGDTEQAPRFGIIQNFGVTQQPAFDMPTNGCQVGLSMRNRNQPRQILDLNIRLGSGASVLIVTVLYPMIGKPGDRVSLRLSGRTLELATAVCQHERCIASARVVGSDANALVSTHEMTVLFPGVPNGDALEAEIPVQKLGLALSELKATSGS